MTSDNLLPSSVRSDKAEEHNPPQKPPFKIQDRAKHHNPLIHNDFL